MSDCGGVLQREGEDVCVYMALTCQDAGKWLECVCDRYIITHGRSSGLRWIPGSRCAPPVDHCSPSAFQQFCPILICVCDRLCVFVTVVFDSLFVYGRQ
jgi:hypothetical protein